MAARRNQIDYSNDFSRRRRAADGPPWLRRLRERGMERFAELGFPTTDLEDWRFTDVSPIASTQFGPPAAGRFTSAAVAVLRRPAVRIPGAIELVFVNGRLSRELSSPSRPPGVAVEGLAEGLAAEPERIEPYLSGFDLPFAAWNTAFFDDGALVMLPAGADAEPPIHLIFLTDAGEPTVAHIRNLVVAGAGSRATVIESHLGGAQAPFLANVVTEVALGAGAVVELVKLQHEGDESYHVALTRVRQDRDSRFASHTVSLGAAIARNDVNVELAGMGGQCLLNGLTPAAGRRLADSHTFIDHAAPQCASRELYKTVLAGRARAVFNGRVLVRPGAQKTDARQTNRTLLLSDDAVIDTKPQLEIFADDVKCTHGAAVGRLDEEAIFYLRTRGIGRDEARRMLTLAFAGEVVDQAPPVVRPILADLLAGAPALRVLPAGTEAA